MDTSRGADRRAGRIWSFDALRAAASFGVVLLHVNPEARLAAAPLSPAWFVMTLLGCLFSWSVPVFFMISGALLLDPERQEPDPAAFWRRRLPRLGTSFLFWSALYALAHCLLYGKGKWTFLNQLLRGHYHMWFLFAIAALYWIAPLLRPAAAAGRLLRAMLLSGFVLSFLAPRLLSFAALLQPPHGDVLASAQSALFQLNPYRSLASVYYFLLGYRLHADPPRGTKRRLLLSAGLAAPFAACALSALQAVRTGASQGAFTGIDSLPVLAASAAVFLLFDGMPAPRGARARAVSLLSSAAFGVYLAHPFLLERMSPAFPESPAPLLAGILFWSLLIYLLSALAARLLARIPAIGRLIV